MRLTKSRSFCILLPVLLALAPQLARAQLSEDGLIAAEEVVIEEALAGALVAAETPSDGNLVGGEETAVDEFIVDVPIEAAVASEADGVEADAAPVDDGLLSELPVEVAAVAEDATEAAEADVDLVLDDSLLAVAPAVVEEKGVPQPMEGAEIVDPAGEMAPADAGLVAEDLFVDLPAAETAEALPEETADDAAIIEDATDDMAAEMADAAEEVSVDGLVVDLPVEDATDDMAVEMSDVTEEASTDALIADLPVEAGAEVALEEADGAVGVESPVENLGEVAGEAVDEGLLVELPGEVVPDVDVAPAAEVVETAVDEGSDGLVVTLPDDEVVAVQPDPTVVAEEAAAEAPVAAEDVGAVEQPATEAAVAEGLDQIGEDAFRDAVAEGVPVAPAPAVSTDVPVEPVVPVVVEDPAIAAARAAAAAKQREIDLLSGGEVLRRKAYERHAVGQLKEAHQAVDDRRFEDAEGLFKRTLMTLGQAGMRGESRRLRAQANKGLGEMYYRWALALREQMDIETAEQMAKRAASFGYAKASKLLREIAAAKAAPEEDAVVEVPPRQERWKDEDYKEQRDDLTERLRVGREYLATREYDRAQLQFEGVLKRDPHNTEAIRMLQKVSQRKYDIAGMELNATRDDMMQQLRKTWSRRNYAAGEEKAALEDLQGRARPLPEAEKQRKNIIEKMERIIIPELDFRQANIHDVIDFLQESSVDFDTADVPEREKGVNIILKLQTQGPPAPAAAPASDDPWGTEPDAGLGTGGETSQITFSARYISLLEALNIVTEVADLKYRIDGSVVMIVPSDAPEGNIIHRMYDVLPTVIDKISAFSSDLGGGRRDAGDFTAMDTGGVGGETTDLKEFFGQMGVPWPATSSIKYISALGKIVVANTAVNLTVFENILAVLDVVPKQVEIEARFVEVLQTDLDSLGFEWLLTDDWELAQKKGQGNVPVGGKERIVVRQNDADGGFSQGNRFLRGGIEGIDGLFAADSILTMAGVLTNPELTFVLHALQQKGNADLLSAPKVMTQSGSEATIKVVTEYIYPTEYELVQGAVAEGVVAPPAVVAMGFETREVGVILSVLPEVSPEGQMINLTLQPEVVSPPEWKDYGYDWTMSVQGGAALSTVHLPMEQPFFFTRTIQTSLLIYNGATVVMGGMITEERNDVDDRVPFLGDIPVIGRLFRSKYERSEKRNLLIFVTARLVDPAGLPVGGPKAGLIEDLGTDIE